MITGIDTSHYSNYTAASLQDTARANKLYFNLIKASEGATLQDGMFSALWTMSRKAGLLCGAYHFFRPLADAAAQAANFLAQYKTVNRAGALPPVIDLEWSATRTTKDQWPQLTPAQRLHAIRTFLDTLEDDLSVRPMIYTAPAFWNALIEPALSTGDRAAFGNYPLWVVDLNHSGRLPVAWARSSAALVQTHFGESATTPGLFDKTDQNVCPGGLKSLLNLATPSLAFMKGFPFSWIVSDLQNSLVAKGFLPADQQDGYFGDHTFQAVQSFQASAGLTSTGIIDSQTWNKLL